MEQSEKHQFSFNAKSDAEGLATHLLIELVCNSILTNKLLTEVISKDLTDEQYQKLIKENDDDLLSYRTGLLKYLQDRIGK